MRSHVWIAAGLAVMAWLPTSARAYEDRATLGLAVGYSGLPDSDSLPQHGLGFTVSAGVGIGDAWNIQGLFGYSFLPDESPLHLSMIGLETVYAFDIVRFVPLIGFGVDGLLSVRESRPRGDFALHLLLGVDFLINPRWILGAEARGFWVTTQASSRLGPFVVTAVLRGGVRFDLR